MKILGIGIATVDIIHITKGYPHEDDEVRAIKRRVQRGGNICNTLVVLSQLGNDCIWSGTLGDDQNADIVLNDLRQYQVESSYCSIIQNGITPGSCIILNAENGSRTIVHYRNLPELSFAQFHRCLTKDLQWCHFEGRNINELQKMLQFLSDNYPHLPYSVEIEKPRDQIESIIEGASVAFFSQKYAQEKGFQNSTALFEYFHPLHPKTQLVCTWGAQGAYAYDGQSSTVIHQPAVSLTAVIDSVGAGDTFTAGFLHQWWKTGDLRSAVQFATILAAKKCTQHGFEGLNSTS